MQKDILKKKSYIRPEAEAVWMEEEDLIAATAGGEHEGWDGPERPSGTGNVKRNVVRTNQWDDWEDEEEDDGWVY